MKLLIENFRKFLKEQEEFDEYKSVVEIYTDESRLLKKVKEKEGNKKEAAFETIEDMKAELGDGRWDENEALEALRDKGKDVGENETLQDVIEDLISDAIFDEQNV